MRNLLEINISGIIKNSLAGMGRAAERIVEETARRLVVFPENLSYRDFLIDSADKLERIYWAVPETGFWEKAKFLSRLGRFLYSVREVDLYLVPHQKRNFLFVILVILSRFLGKRVNIHNSRFLTRLGEPEKNRLFYLANSLEFSEDCLMGDGVEKDLCPSIKVHSIDREIYSGFRKNKAVPHVLVYGDYDRRAVMALVNNAFDMVKQKYPRTEFSLVSFYRRNNWVGSQHNGFLKFINPVDENDIREIFNQADILLLTTPGGFNSTLTCRARVAGYPLITNGFELSAVNLKPHVVPRDSYSAIADEIIRMVDDEDYYRRCRDVSD